MTSTCKQEQTLFCCAHYNGVENSTTDETAKLKRYIVANIVNKHAKATLPTFLPTSFIFTRDGQECCLIRHGWTSLQFSSVCSAWFFFCHNLSQLSHYQGANYLVVVYSFGMIVAINNIFVLGVDLVSCRYRKDYFSILKNETSLCFIKVLNPIALLFIFFSCFQFSSCVAVIIDL